MLLRPLGLSRRLFLLIQMSGPSKENSIPTGSLGRRYLDVFVRVPQPSATRLLGNGGMISSVKHRSDLAQTVAACVKEFRLDPIAPLFLIAPLLPRF
jgi:hypothetical protein